MKRKDWKKKDLKEGFYGKKNKIRYFLKTKNIFLRKLFIRRYKYLLRKDLYFNYIFYKSMLNLFKKKKQIYMVRSFFKNFQNTEKFYPEFSVFKNVFNKKHQANKLFKKYNLKYGFSSNNFNKSNFGLSYYIVNLNNDDQKRNFQKFNIELEEEENRFLIQKKNINNDFFYKFNYYFNYNLKMLNCLEIYKIILILYINKIIKKYIYVGLNPKQILVDLKKN